MLIRGDWRYLRGDPPESSPAVTWGAAIVFAVVWVVVSVMLLGALTLRFL